MVQPILNQVANFDAKNRLVLTFTYLGPEMTTANTLSIREDKPDSEPVYEKDQVSLDKSDILYNVFDALPLSEFLEGKSTKPFIERKRELTAAFQGTSMMENAHLRLVQNLYEGSELGAIRRLQKELVEPLDWEGLMINLADGKYECKRTSNLLKVKEFFDADVVVKDVFEGTGRLEHTLGGVIVDYKGYDVRVGTGFSQTDRDYYWEHQEELIGKVIQISYFEETHNQKDNNISLRFPVFTCTRADKTVADVSYEI